MKRFFLKLYFLPRLAWLLTLHWQGRFFVFRAESDRLVSYVADSLTSTEDKHMGSFIQEARDELARRASQAKR